MNLFKNFLKRQTGFTLIEILIAIILLSILAGVAAPLLFVSVSAITLHVGRVNLEESGDLALSRISREIRHLKDDKNIVTANGSDFQFLDVNSLQIRYYLSGNTLMRTAAGTDSGLTDQVQAGGLVFTYYDDDGNAIATPTVGIGTATNIRRIQVETIFQNGASVLPFRTQIRPKNLRHESDRFF